MSTTQQFANKTTTNLAFSNISVTETDTGTVTPFLGASSSPILSGKAVGSYQALDFSAFSSGAIYAGSSISLEFKYDVTSTTPGLGISSLQQAFTPDAYRGSVHLSIMEKVYDVNNNLVGTTFTDLSNVFDPASGTYTLGDLLLNNSYGLLHVAVTLVASVDATDTSATPFVFLSDIEQGFGVSTLSAAPLPGTVTGRVFLDANADGAQQAGDTNLAGVTVQLLDSNGNIIVGSTTTTDANGAYSFTGLAAGTYSVAFTAPNGDRFSVMGPDNVVNPNGKTNSFVVKPGDVIANQNAALYVPATITTTIYADANKDGILNNGEKGLAGVTVNLVNSGGTTVATTTTDANGIVSFGGLVPGSYTVTVVTPAGDIVTQPVSTSPIKVSGLGGPAGTAIEGLFIPGTLSGHAFLDANANGVQESGDTNLGGVTVTLYNSAGTATGATAVTDANGSYSFTGLIAGSYSVGFTAPSGDKFSIKGTDNLADATGRTALVPVLAGSVTANQNAALYVPATITTTIYADANKNMMLDNGEKGLAGVTVNLVNSAGATVATTTTDANGIVNFSGLVPGSYTVTVVTPAGDIVTQPVSTKPIQVLSGQTRTATEGLFVPAGLSGHIFLDQNDNGVQESGDNNLSGVTVSLLNSAGIATGATAVTDANGFYSFTGLIADSYSVKFAAPGGYKFDTVTGTNADGSVDSIVNTSGQTAAVAVTAGNTTANQNAGVFAPVTIAEHVYLDNNNNGVQDGGDANLAGVTVNLFASNGKTLLGTGLSDSNGNVSFTGYNPGTYVIGAITPTGDGTAQWVNAYWPTSVNSGGTLNAIQGFTARGTINTHVYTDANNDKAQNNGETNLAGVSVSLLNSAGAVVATTTTDVNGNVSFANIVAGTYSVAIVTPTGDIVTQATNVGSTITLAAGQTVTATEGLFVPASLCGRVFMDVNANGVFDAGTTTTTAAGPNLIVNGSFEAQSVSSSGVFANGCVTGWTSNNNEIEIDNYATIGQSSPYAGTQSVELNGSNYDTISQTVTGLVVGKTYTLSYAYGGRAGSGNEKMNVSLGGQQVATNTSNGVNNLGWAVTTVSVVATATTEVLSFAAVSAGGSCSVGNELDGVSLVAAPVTTTTPSDYGLANQTVTLLTSTGASTGVTTTTDANGNYCFTGLVAGSYEVAVSPLSGTKFSPVGTNADPSLDSIVNTAGIAGTTAKPISVVAGQTTSNVNAGEYKPATFTAHVYTDLNNNKTQDATDTNFAGVTVNLLTGAGVATGQTAVTDASGNVSFSGLAPGSYEVQVVTPAGDTVTQALNVMTPTTLAAGDTANAIEGLFVPKAGIQIVKTASVSQTSPGVGCPPLTYTFQVTNTGNTALSNVKVVDVLNGNASTSVTYTDPNVLAAGATWTYTTPAQVVAETKNPTPTTGTGHGFDLGDVATYGIIAFNPKTFSEGSKAPVVGNVGVGSYGALNITGGGIAGDLETTGALPGYNSGTTWNWSTFSWSSWSTGCATQSCVSGQDTSYGSAGWAANWGTESSGGSNCYSSYGCGGSTGSQVWDQFWSQCTTAASNPLVLNVSEDAWQGNAQFTVMVDGKQVGGTYTATACHGAGQTQAINLGNYAAGQHTVSVNFINDTYGGTSSTDRNLYVDGLTLGGGSINGGAQTSNGAVSYTVGSAATCTTKAITLNVSEDSWQGDAQYTVTVDGKQVGGTYTSTACHGSGQSQAINLGNYSLGNHVIAVNFLNDAYGGTSSTDRNLYIDSITSNGCTTGGQKLGSSGIVSFNHDTGSVGGDDADDTWGAFCNTGCSTYNSNYGGSAYGQIANSASLAADIAGLKTLSTTLFSEAGTTVSLASGATLSATSGKLDATGNEVFTVTGWSNNFKLIGDGSHSVVLNVASNQTVTLGQLTLSGGISANQVMINYTGTNTITDCGGTTNATVLATNAAFNIQNGTINGHLLGGAAGQDFTIGSCATVEAPVLKGYTLTDVATVSGTSGGTTVSSFDTASVLVNPSGAGVSQNCSAPPSCDNLWSNFGQLGKLQFTFNPGSSCNTHDTGCAITSGSCNTGSNPCFVVITDKASDSTNGCNTYFQGNVTSGEKICADASLLWDGTAASGCFSQNAGSMLYAHVFNSQADFLAGKAATQECGYDTSGAHAISANDQIGCLTVSGYVSTSGHGYLS